MTTPEQPQPESKQETDDVFDFKRHPNGQLMKKSPKVLTEEQLQKEKDLREEGQKIRLIALTNGAVCKVDDEDYEWAQQSSWRLSNFGYAARSLIASTRGQSIVMHKEIMKTPRGMDTDHINGDKLDNRKSNLRICTAAQNKINREVQKNNKLGVKGVIFCQNAFRATIRFKGKGKHLGCFKTIEQAVEAYNQAAKKLFGEFFRESKLPTTPKEEK